MVFTVLLGGHNRNPSSTYEDYSEISSTEMISTDFPMKMPSVTSVGYKQLV